MFNQGPKALFFCILLTLAFSAAAPAQAPQTSQPQQPKIDWQRGPNVGHLGDMGQIKIPQGYQFTGKAGAQEVLRLTHNIPNGKELGAIVPSSDNENWFMIFEYDDTGHVKDDEKDSLDADALLKSIKEGTEAGNEERRKHGWNAFHVTGWQKPPYYDPQTHNLTWAIQGRGDDPISKGSINHSIRLLGREGTINVDLVASPDEYTASIPEFNTLISGFSYTDGHRYADFRSGDKIAKYGLAALIAGGAAGVALKTGLLAKLIKPLIVGLVALGAFIKKIFKAIFGGNEQKVEDPMKNAAGQG